MSSTDKTRRGVPHLRVEAWDKDHIHDEFIHQTRTDEDGGFQMAFEDTAFKEWFIDQGPDLYFKVFRDTELLANTEDAVLWNVEKGETEVVIEVDNAIDTRMERARGQFRALLLTNPNYFGNLKESPFTPVLPIQSNTTYEEIGGSSHEPQFGVYTFYRSLAVI